MGHMNAQYCFLTDREDDRVRHRCQIHETARADVRPDRTHVGALRATWRLVCGPFGLMGSS